MYSGFKKVASFTPNFTLMKLVKNYEESKSEAKLAKSGGSKFQIFIVPLSGLTFPILVKSSDKILSMKEKIWGRLGTPAKEQSLLYNGRGLKDDATVAKVSLKPNCIIHMVHRLAGGCATIKLNSS